MPQHVFELTSGIVVSVRSLINQDESILHVVICTHAHTIHYRSTQFRLYMSTINALLCGPYNNKTSVYNNFLSLNPKMLIKWFNISAYYIRILPIIFLSNLLSVLSFPSPFCLVPLSLYVCYLIAGFPLFRPSFHKSYFFSRFSSF